MPKYPDDYVKTLSHLDVRAIHEELCRLNDKIDKVCQIDEYPQEEIDKMELQAAVYRVIWRMAIKELGREE